MWSFPGVSSPWRLTALCGLVLVAFGLSCVALVSLRRVSRTTLVTYYLKIHLLEGYAAVEVKAENIS